MPVVSAASPRKTTRAKEMERLWVDVVQDDAAPARFYDDYDVDGNPDHLDVLEAVLEMINRQKARKSALQQQKGS